MVVVVFFLSFVHRLFSTFAEISNYWSRRYTKKEIQDYRNQLRPLSTNPGVRGGVPNPMASKKQLTDDILREHVADLQVSIPTAGSVATAKSSRPTWYLVLA